MATDPITTTGAAGTTDATTTEKKDKVPFKEKVKAALTKKREYSVLGIVKTVGMIVAIPVAVAIGKGIQKAEDQQLLEAGLGGDTYAPEPLSLPAPEQEVQQDTAVDVEYTEVE